MSRPGKTRKYVLPDGWKSVVVRMPRDLHEAIKAAAKANDRSMAQEMRYALRRWVES